MTHKRIDGPKPLPRLMHIQPGQFFTLRFERKPMLMLDRCAYYAYVESGKIALSSELDPELSGMDFGVSGGWRQKP